MTYEDQFCEWLFEQGVDPFEISQLAFVELPEDWSCERGAEPTTPAELAFAYEEHVAAFDAKFLAELKISA